MAELDPLDTRLSTAVRAFADRAQTSVDAADVAERAKGLRPAGRLAWLGTAVAVPVSLLILLALLVLALALTLGVGAGRGNPGFLAPIAPTAPATATQAALATPSASPDPASDGIGDEVVTGTDRGPSLAGPAPSFTVVRGVTQVRDVPYENTATMSDPRVSGTGTWILNYDDHGTTGPAWGAYRLENAGGTWEGSCSGGLTQDGLARSCWLTGKGAYDGYFYYLTETLEQGAGDIRGVITPGPPGTP